MDFTNIPMLLAGALILVVVQYLIVSARATHSLDRRPDEHVPLLGMEAEKPKPVVFHLLWVDNRSYAYLEGIITG